MPFVLRPCLNLRGPPWHHPLKHDLAFYSLRFTLSKNVGKKSSGRDSCSHLNVAAHGLCCTWQYLNGNCCFSVTFPTVCVAAKQMLKPLLILAYNQNHHWIAGRVQVCYRQVFVHCGQLECISQAVRNEMFSSMQQQSSSWFFSLCHM